MKKQNFLGLIVLFFVGLGVFGGCDESTSPGTVIDGPKQFEDPRDQSTYSYQTFGNADWMSGNLNAGQMISAAGLPTLSSVEKYCVRGQLDSCQKYGGLYPFVEVFQLEDSCSSVSCDVPAEKKTGICPQGWEVPTQEDLDTLLTGFGGWSNLGLALQSENDFGIQFPLGGIRFAKGSTVGSYGASGYYMLRPVDSVDQTATQIQVALFTSTTNEIKIYKVDKTAGVSVKCLRKR